jgi:4-hydroxy-L-threonine phosphate dehydrogenase PdxA
MLQRLRVGITMGDPAGIGPEVIAKALAHKDIREQADYLIIGDKNHFQKISSSAESSVSFLDMANVPEDLPLGQVSREAGLAAWQYLNKAVQLLLKGELQALVTAPVCKEAICLNNIPFQGHTEFLADAFDSQRVGMLFVAGDMRTIIVTRHLALRKVSESLSADKVYQTIDITHQGLVDLFLIQKPTIGVCGLNPHAGEGGRLGGMSKIRLFLRFDARKMTG